MEANIWIISDQINYCKGKLYAGFFLQTLLKYTSEDFHKISLLSKSLHLWNEFTACAKRGPGIPWDRPANPVPGEPAGSF